MATVLEIQRALLARGYDIGRAGADGIMGRATTAGIAKFQRDKNLAVKWPGTIGPITLAALGLSGEAIADKAGKATPVWIIEARRHLGLHEVRDAKKLDKLLRMDTSAIAWCGGFVGYVIAAALPTEPLPASPLWARNWLKLGSKVDAGKPALGDVAVFSRGSGGHVGFVVGHDATALHVLGGNQSNQVSIARVTKNRLLGLRWPSTGGERGGALSITKIAGTLSRNEA
jgi:uncharacterized protein (TIGR02594 family)